jgi:hypothetical protein
VLFYLHPSLAQIAKNSSNTQQTTKLKDIIEDLLIARRRGINVIYSDRGTFNILMGIPGLSDRAKDVMLKLRNRLAEKRAIYQGIPIFIQIIDGNSIFKRELSEHGQEIITISVDMLPDSMDFFAPSILAENSTDIDLYTLITIAWRRSKFPSESLNIKLSPVPGGGSQTPRIYNDIKKQKKLCLCIVDGDVTFEGGPTGDIAKQIIVSDAENPNPLTKSVVIPCYSLENLLPPKIVRDAHGLQSAPSKKVVWLELLEQHALHDYWPYLTIKKTIKCEDIKKPSERAEYFKHKINFQKINISCTHNAVNLDGCNQNCTIISAASDKMAKFVLDFLAGIENNSTSYLAESCEAYPVIFDLWGKIAQNITAWGISGSKMSATNS